MSVTGRLPRCPSSSLLFILLLLLVAQVEGLQGGLRLRFKISPPKSIIPRRSGLFQAQKQQHRFSTLYEQKVNGSGTSSSNSSNESQPKSRRSRIRRLWSSVFHSKQQSQLGSAVLAAPPATEEIVDELETENKLLRETIRQLELENDRLSSQRKVILESFEGEGKLRQPSSINGEGLKEEHGPMTMEEMDMMNYGITLTEEELTGDVAFAKEGEEPLWCDDLEEDTCPIEPTVSFGTALRDRAYWLVGLLAMQSCSGLILSRNEALLANHPVIIYFLTMLVGAGGNAGNQASVRVIRGIALGTLNEKTQGQFLSREFKMAASLSSILSIAGFLRAAAFRTPFPETVAVTASLALIVFSSICLGAILPLLLQKMGVDPAHSSTTIQVVMDILGVFVAVAISGLILDSPMGVMLMSRLGG